MFFCILNEKKLYILKDQNSGGKELIESALSVMVITDI